MMRKPMTLAVSATLLAAVGAIPALAQVDHASRVASELALRRAQVRALMACEMEATRTGTPARPMTAPMTAEEAARRLPLYPPTGTGGPVRQTECPPRR